MERFLGTYADYLYAAMRIVIGLLFACNGARKLFGVFGGMGGSGEPAPPDNQRKSDATYGM